MLKILAGFDEFGTLTEDFTATVKTAFSLFVIDGCKKTQATVDTDNVLDVLDVEFFNVAGYGQMEIPFALQLDNFACAKRPCTVEVIVEALL